MGINIFHRNCMVYEKDQPIEAPNPDPIKFEILRTEAVGDHLVALIRYPNCTNFEGVKICVFLNTTSYNLHKRVSIDPHFDSSDISPFARFKPDSMGWHMAIKLAILMLASKQECYDVYGL